MIIQKKRIRNLERYLSSDLQGQKLRVGVSDSVTHEKNIKRAGFADGPLTAGDAILPAIVGPITRFNAEGKYKVRRDLSMETAYRLVEWHWQLWDGTPQSDFKNVPYQRYPREFIPPPSVELQILSDSANRLLVVTKPFLYEGADSVDLLHAVNVCLELFGECEVFTPELVSTLPPSTRRLNWEILPQGRYPWEQVKELLEPIVARAKKGHQGAITMRLDAIGQYNPDFTAIGTAGFSGYVIFGFPNKRLFILESAFYGNATYVFDKNWETLAQLTKAEILDQKLQKDRLIHLEGWPLRLGRLFSKF